jgi:hypothetical protein
MEKRTPARTNFVTFNKKRAFLSVSLTLIMLLGGLGALPASGDISGYKMHSSVADAHASFIGEDAADGSGVGMQIVKDINGDGYDDLVMGSNGNDYNGVSAGQAYIKFGGPSNWTMRTSLAKVDASFVGERPGSQAGYKLAGGGDLNGDGYNDLVIGAFSDSEAGANAGQTYVVFGRSSGWSMRMNLSKANASYWGEGGGNSGYDVAVVGDVNHDGFDDFIIGGIWNNKVYLILGKSAGWAMDQNLANADASFIGPGGELTGHSVAGAGDVNHDGYDDFIIGGPFGGIGGGKAYLVFGRSSGWAKDVDLSTGANASFIGAANGDQLGWYAVKGLGDINGDGYDDIGMGAGNNDEGGADAGQMYIFFGKPSGWARDVSVNTADASFWGEAAGDHAGYDITGGGDVNGDGLADIMITASGRDCYLVLGKKTGWATDVSLNKADASFFGEGSYVGWEVSNEGDLNGNGFDDIAMVSRSGAGQTYVVFYDSRPSTPKDFVVALSMAGDQLTVSWDKVLHIRAIDHYTVYRSVDGSNYMPVAQVNTTTFKWADTNVKLGITYYYKVMATDFMGWESLSSEPFAVVNDIDTDLDGLGNMADTDDDGDGVPDGQDVFPLNGTETLDTDRDGIGNNADPDDDNDGIPDLYDAEPLNPLNGITDRLSWLNSSLGWIGYNVTTIQTDLGTVNNTLSSVQDQLVDLNGDIAVFQNNTTVSLKDILDSLEALGNKDDTINATIEYINSTLQDMDKTTLKELSTKLVELRERLSKMDGNQTTLITDVDSLITKVGSFQSEADHRMSDINNETAKLNDVPADVKDLKDKQKTVKSGVDAALMRDMIVMVLLIIAVVLVLVSMMTRPKGRPEEPQMPKAKAAEAPVKKQEEKDDEDESEDEKEDGSEDEEDSKSEDAEEEK